MKCIDTGTRSNLSLELFQGFKESQGERKKTRERLRRLSERTVLHCHVRQLDITMQRVHDKRRTYCFYFKKIQNFLHN